MTHISAYHRILLGTIFEAYDRVRAIPAKKWDDNLFYDPVTSRSNLFGHYVRMIPAQITINPGTISNNKYMLLASPLSHALNEFIDLVMPNHLNIWDAYSIVAGMHQGFTNPDPKQRCMDIFQRIIEKYPRSLLQEKVAVKM